MTSLHQLPLNRYFNIMMVYNQIFIFSTVYTEFPVCEEATPELESESVWLFQWFQQHTEGLYTAGYFTFSQI